jgi:hypothetical protein
MKSVVHRAWLPCGALACVAVPAPAIDLQNATATFSQTQTANFFASTMIDNDMGMFTNGWAIYDPNAPAALSTTSQAAAFETVTDYPAGQIRLTLRNLYFDGVHNVGRFSLSATTADRSTFCDGLQTGGDVDTQWFILIPGLITLPPGMTGTVMVDMSVRISGPNTPGLYSVTYNPPPIGNITGFRLDVVEDPTLPTNGPGRAPNGNFVITELRILRYPCVADLSTGAVASQPGYGVPDDRVNNDDFFFYLAEFAAGNVARCDLTFSAVPSTPGYGFPNGILDNEDFFYYLTIFAAGC